MRTWRGQTACVHSLTDPSMQRQTMQLMLATADDVRTHTAFGIMLGRPAADCGHSICLARVCLLSEADQADLVF